MRWLTPACAMLILLVLTACDTQIPQTVVVRASPIDAGLNSVWLVESDKCESTRIRAGWYRNGLWIFRLSSTRGGIGVVTQELTLCQQEAETSYVKIWHSVHGGGAPLILLSCESESCSLYMEGHAEGTWTQP